MKLTADGLKKTYGDFTLDIPDLTVPSGTALGLVGNNGAGKTTFQRLVLDLIEADGGTVRVGGMNVAASFDWKLRTGSFLGNSFLIGFQTPDEYWRFVGSTYGMSPAEVEDRLDAFRDFYTDEPIGKTTRYVRDLSRGNKNKVGVISALLPKPDLLVLDEPFASLDPRSQIWLKEHLQSLKGKMTMLLSSHDLGYVTDVSTRIVILEAGQVVRDAETDPDTLQDLTDYFRQRIRPKEESVQETSE